MPIPIIATLGAVILASPAPATPPDKPALEVVDRILVERRVAAADGTTRIVASPRGRAAPGDRLVVEVSYRNGGTRPIADVVLADPVPAALAYRSIVPGTPLPEVSVDGRRFAPLTALTVTLPGGEVRAAVADDVVALRWRLPATLAPGAGGTLSFRAVLR